MGARHSHGSAGSSRHPRGVAPGHSPTTVVTLQQHPTASAAPSVWHHCCCSCAIDHGSSDAFPILIPILPVLAQLPPTSTDVRAVLLRPATTPQQQQLAITGRRGTHSARLAAVPWLLLQVLCSAGRDRWQPEKLEGRWSTVRCCCSLPATA